MANVFPPDSRKKFFLMVSLGSLLILVALAWIYGWHQADVVYSPTQPVRFSHQRHVGVLGMDCTTCHSLAYQSDKAGIPDTQSCLGCHRHILADSELIRPLRVAADPDFPGYTGEPVRWVMVNRLAGHAYFNHMAHVTRGIGCTTCHENIIESDRTEAPLSNRMSWCLDCHRNPTPFLRPLEFIADPHYSAERYLQEHTMFQTDLPRLISQQELGDFLQKQWNIRPQTDCTTCHH